MSNLREIPCLALKTHLNSSHDMPRLISNNATFEIVSVNLALDMSDAVH